MVEEISQEEVMIFINSNKAYFEKENFTFFEMSGSSGILVF